MRLLGNTLLIKIHKEVDDTTESGLIMSTVEQNDATTLRATVIQVSGGYTENGVQVGMKTVVGDEVIISKHGGQDVTIKGEVYRVLRQPDILVILEKGDLED